MKIGIRTFLLYYGSEYEFKNFVAKADVLFISGYDHEVNEKIIRPVVFVIYKEEE